MRLAIPISRCLAAAETWHDDHWEPTWVDLMLGDRTDDGDIKYGNTGALRIRFVGPIIMQRHDGQVLHVAHLAISQVVYPGDTITFHLDASLEILP